MALELARELNLTTVGFVRDPRFNIYTVHERVAEVGT
jgi:formate dehydrogenase assembly factor FdhD